MQRLLLALQCLIIAFFCALSLHWVTISPFSDLELLLDDLRTEWFVPESVHPSIVIIDIDEKSLQQIGQWPWSRNTLANLLETLHEHYNVKVTGLDFVIAESTRHDQSYLEFLQSSGFATFNQPIDQLSQLHPEDDRLAEVMQGKAIVPGFVFKNDSTLNLNQLPESIAKIDRDTALTFDLIQAKGFTGNIEAVNSAAPAQGFFDNPIVDRDGVYRRAALLQLNQQAVYPALSLRVAQVAISADLDQLAPIVFEPEPIGNALLVNFIQLGRFIIPTAEHASVRVPFMSSQSGFHYFSAVDVLNRDIEIEKLQQKIVLIGTTAPGLKDIRSTAVNPNMPGVEIHANIIAGILSNSIPFQPSWGPAATLFQLTVVSILLLWLYQSHTPWWRMAGTLFILALSVTGNLIAWQQGLILALAPNLALIIMLYSFTTSWQLLSENYNRQKITRIFGQYVPRSLVPRLTNISSDQLLRGEEKELTVLFSDVRGFTSISESLRPEQLTDLMNRLLTPLTSVIYHHQGTIDKYMGDAIMAFWGAPIAMNNHANQAVEAALEMQTTIEALQADLSDFQVKNLAMGIGINTGTMCVGNMGSEYRMAYTVMGDAVNLGSRLEALTRQYGLPILVSESTANAANDYLFLPIDRVRVKGKQEPVTILAPLINLKNKHPTDELLVQQMTLFLEAYRKQQWGQASEILESIQARPQLQGFALLYRERMDVLSEQNLPEQWDGVFTFTSK